MTDDKHEREHCRIAVAEASMSGNVTPDWLHAQRAAARAQGDAQGYERGRSEGPHGLLAKDVNAMLVELNALRAQLGEACRVSRENSKRALVAESKYDTLAAAARAVQAVVAKYRGPCNADPGEFIREVCAAIAALGSAPAPFPEPDEVARMRRDASLVPGLQAYLFRVQDERDQLQAQYEELREGIRDLRDQALGLLHRRGE